MWLHCISQTPPRNLWTAAIPETCYQFFWTLLRKGLRYFQRTTWVIFFSLEVMCATADRTKWLGRWRQMSPGRLKTQKGSAEQADNLWTVTHTSLAQAWSTHCLLLAEKRMTLTRSEICFVEEYWYSVLKERMRSSCPVSNGMKPKACYEKIPPQHLS